MFLTKITIATVALVVGMIALGGGMFAYRTLAAEEPVGSFVEQLRATHNHPGANRRKAAQPAQPERITDTL
jgi:hypothetical protein